MDKLLLVQLIKNCPNLYDNKRNDFKDKTQRFNSWRAIASSLNVSVDYCQKVWKDLRDRYVKEKRKLERSSAGSDPYEPTWALFESLQFLNNHISYRRASVKEMNSPTQSIIKKEEEPPCFEVHYVNSVMSDDSLSAISENLRCNTSSVTNNNNDFLSMDDLNVSKDVYVNSVNQVNCLVQKEKKLRNMGTEEALLTTLRIIKDNVSEDNASKLSPDIAFGRYVGLCLANKSKIKKRRIKRKIIEILEVSDESDLE